MKYAYWTALAVVLLTLMGCGAGESGSGDSAQAAPPHPGEKTYNTFCFSCHAAGVAGAPRLGDVEAWAPLLAKGKDVLLATTIEGVPPGMPARGMCMSCTDEQLEEVVDYMILKSQ